MSGDSSERAAEFLSKNKFRYLIMAAVLIGSVLLAVYSFGKGSQVISMDKVWEVIGNHLHNTVPSRSDDYWGWLYNRLIFEGTIPVGIGALLVGAILGMAGAVMQNCVRNPLADPYTTGISSAALFGVTINLALGISILPVTEDAGNIVNALVFAMIPCALMLLLSIRGKTTTTQLVLIGIGVMYLFSAITMMLKYNAEPEILNQIYAWSVGSVSKIGWTGVYCLLPTTILLFISLYILSPRIDVVAMGDNMSHSLGVDPVRTRLLCMVIISCATAVAVSFSGSIGFVGLVIPHVSRLLVGSKSKMLIPCSAVLGTFLLIGAEILSRMLTQGLPAGAITALIGAPVFLYFLFKIRTNGWGK